MDYNISVISLSVYKETRIRSYTNITHNKYTPQNNKLHRHTRTTGVVPTMPIVMPMVIAMVTAMVMLLANTNGYCQTLTGIIMAAMIHSKAIMLQCTGYDTNKGGIHDTRSIDTPGTFIRLANAPSFFRPFRDSNSVPIVGGLVEGSLII
jgi:hypothetical protein